MRFLNGYEIPYQAEDFFEVPGTSVQVSDKKFISIILCGNIADGSNYKHHQEKRRSAYVRQLHCVRAVPCKAGQGGEGFLYFPPDSGGKGNAERGTVRDDPLPG